MYQDNSAKHQPGTILEDVRAEENRINCQLMPDAGKVPLDAPMGWGRGIYAEIKECVFGWWLKVRCFREISYTVPTHILDRDRS